MEELNLNQTLPRQITNQISIISLSLILKLNCCRNNLVISRQKMMSLFFQITDTLYLRMSIRRVQLTGGPPWGLRLTGGAEGSQGLKVKHFLSLLGKYSKKKKKKKEKNFTL